MDTLPYLNELAKKFLETGDKPVMVISHHDTDGITSASILAKALKRLDKRFTLRIVKNLEKEFIETLPKDHVLFFLDLASSNLEEIKKLGTEAFILDHHEVPESIPDGVFIVNPHLHEKELLSGAGLTYLFSKAISHDNMDLAPLAVIGMVGDMLDQNLSKLANTVLNDAEISVKKGLLIYPATRPLYKALEYSSIYIPGVTGSSRGAISMLKDIGIREEKSLMELDDEEMSKLVTTILLRRMKKDDASTIIGNIYLVKFFNKLEDAREISAMLNACSRLENSHIAIQLCLGSKEARIKAEEIYAGYKQHIMSALRYVSQITKIEGKEYVIINAKEEIKDTIIGTVASILSSSPIYEEGTIIIAMAYNKEKIKVSARISGRKGRNLRELLASVIKEVGGECGGHHLAAGCLITKEKEQEFMEKLQKKLEVEMVRV